MAPLLSRFLAPKTPGQKFALGMGLLLVLALVGLAWEVGYTAWAFARLQPRYPFLPAPEVWSHRGLGGQQPEETVPAWEEAIAHGAQGIEMDIHYFPGLGFALSHQRPRQPMLMLGPTLQHFGRKTHYWLDFKRSERSDLHQVARELAATVKQAGVTDLLVVESPDPDVLQAFHQEGLQTLLWISLSPHPSPWQALREQHRVRSWLLRSGAVGVSGYQGKLPPPDLGFLAGWPLFVFDLATTAETAPFCRLGQVQVFLSRSHSIFPAPCP